MRTEQSKTGTSNHIQEVEKRALLSPQQREKIIEELIQIGAKQENIVQLQDTYFCPNSVMSFSEISMDQIGAYSLRLRKLSFKEDEEVELNVKVITEEADHQEWEEHEVKVTSFQEMQAILNIIGYKRFISIEKVRHIFKWKELSIVVEDILDFGHALEVEVLTTKEFTTQAKEKIDNFLADLGITREQIVPKSITFNIMQERAFF